MKEDKGYDLRCNSNELYVRCMRIDHACHYHAPDPLLCSACTLLQHCTHLQHYCQWQEKQQEEERWRRAQAQAQKQSNKADAKAQKQRIKSIVTFKEKMAQIAKDEQHAREKKDKTLSKRRAQARRQALRVAKRVHPLRPKNREHELGADEQDLGEVAEPSTSMDTGTNQEVDVSSYNIPSAAHPSPDQARLPRLTHSVTLFASPELLLGRTCRKKTYYPKPIVYGLKAPKSRLVVIKPTTNITYGNLLHPAPNPAAKFLYGNTVQQGHHSPVQNTHSTRRTKHNPSPTRRHKVEGPGGRFLRTKNVVLDLSDTFTPLCIRGSPPARQNTYGYVFT